MMSLRKGLLWFPWMVGVFALSILARSSAMARSTAQPNPQQVGEQEQALEQEDVTSVGPADLVSNDGTYRVHWTHPDGELEFGERFKMIVSVERSDGEPLQSQLSVDSRMPEHGHGMKREVRIVELEPGRYEVSGMLFHMPGYWEIYFDLTRGAVTERTQVSVDLY